MAGKQRSKVLKSIWFSARGTENGTSVAQPYYPEKVAPTAHKEKLAVFSDGIRLAYELKTDRGDGTTRWRRAGSC